MWEPNRSEVLGGEHLSFTKTLQLSISVTFEI